MKRRLDQAGCVVSTTTVDLPLAPGPPGSSRPSFQLPDSRNSSAAMGKCGKEESVLPPIPAL